MSEAEGNIEAPLKGVARIAAYVKTLPDAPGVYRMLDAKGHFSDGREPTSQPPPRALISCTLAVIRRPAI